MIYNAKNCNWRIVGTEEVKDNSILSMVVELLISQKEVRRK